MRPTHGDLLLGGTAMRDIQADAKTIQMVLGKRKFGIDYYQREYRWGEKHVQDLIEDLTDSFLEDYDPKHDPKQHQDYGKYFLGSIIVNNKGSRQFIVDGQQRLTTVSLLLVKLHQSIEDLDYKGLIGDCIYSFDGTRSYNLDIDVRNECMDQLFKGVPMKQEATRDPSVSNILSRYREIDRSFSDAISQEESTTNITDISDVHANKLFALWLLNNVYLVEIVADNESDAYAIFETMNDRGMRLTLTEMLRGYLLSQISDTEHRNAAANAWDQRTRSLGKDQETDAIKAWLRSQYASTVRERRRDAVPGDFDLIGSEFHRWVKDNSEELGLTGNQQFADFIRRDFEFYSHWYQRMRYASNRFVSDLKPFFYVGQSQVGFSLHYMAALSTLGVEDSEDDCLRKLNTIATFVDCMLHRRVWSRRHNTRNQLEYRMFRNVTLGVRGKRPPELSDILCHLLDGFGEDFSDVNFGLHRRNGPAVHEMIARMTDYVETESGMDQSYEKYRKRGWGKGRYQIEHVLSESHREDIDDFDYHRNKIGALVLLRAPVNPSLGDMRFEDKRELYLKENLLAATLHETGHAHEPWFRRFKEETGLDFGPYGEFDEVAVAERQELYRQLAMRIWSTDSIRAAAGVSQG